MEENKVIVDKIIDRIGKTEDKVIPILQAIQDEINYLPEDVLKYVCDVTDITPSRVLGISTFYSQFRHKPVGEHMIKVCVGTACHVKGAQQVIDSYKRHLNIPKDEDTDPDGLFTIEEVACLGCCTIAPVVQIDDTTYGYVQTDTVDDTIDDFLENKNNPEAPKVKVVSDDGDIQGEIRIGFGSCCIACGSDDVKKELENSLDENKINVDVKYVGCVGVCSEVPMLEIAKQGEEPTFYTRIKPEEVNEIIKQHFKSKSTFSRFKNNFRNYFESKVLQDIPMEIGTYKANEADSPINKFLEGQKHIAIEHCGVLKPSDIAEYRTKDGFLALEKVLKEMKRQEVIDVVKESGLRGRGGGGFPSGIKWQMVHDVDSDKKYVICNGDEGDPGAFMDRMLLESYPFRVIEGLMIAAYAVGASEGLLYIRAEYPLAVSCIKEALQICRDEGVVGKNIFGTDFSFELEVFEGAGAFVCGEETAMIASIEGKRGLPIMRPPYPAEKGLNGLPTLINNTETFSLLSAIILRGAEFFNQIGTEKSKGTKVFSLAGKINSGGLIEVPMGTTISDIVEKIGGGIKDGKKFKAVQIGGPSGGCLPASMSDTPIDFDSLTQAGVMMGSGGLVVLDEEDCMVDIARYFLAFTQDQSCGRCTFCRIGTKRMLDIMNRICDGKGKMEDLDTLETLSKNVKSGSICGLGRSAPNPVLSTLKYFREEYIAHIEGTCPTGKCSSLISYHIKDDCIGCTKCAQKCPVDAIEFRPHEIHDIDLEKCIKCDVCRQVCPSDSVYIK